MMFRKFGLSFALALVAAFLLVPASVAMASTKTETTPAYNGHTMTVTVTYHSESPTMWGIDYCKAKLSGGQANATLKWISGDGFTTGNITHKVYSTKWTKFDMGGFGALKGNDRLWVSWGSSPQYSLFVNL